MSGLVDFVVIGAQKSGTTSLSYQLSQHPEIDFCRHKEPNFFSKTHDGRSGLDEYHRLFSWAKDKIQGEASTTYSWFPEYPETARRLADYNPNMKLIYVMRQPVERIRSQFTYELLKGRTKMVVDNEVFADPAYVNRSRYGMQLDVYRENFPDSRLLPIIFEEYVEDSRRVLAQIASHLGIDPAGFDNIDLKARNRSVDRLADSKIKNMLAPIARVFPLSVRNLLRRPFVYKLDREISLSPQTQDILWRMLEDDVKVVEQFVGRRIETWRTDMPLRHSQ